MNSHQNPQTHLNKIKVTFKKTKKHVFILIRCFNFKDKPSEFQSKKLHQQLISISSGNSPNSKLNINTNSSNSVFIHRHISNATMPISPIQQQQQTLNTANNFETSIAKNNPNPVDTSVSSQVITRAQLGFKDNNPEEYANITRELRNLNLRQHERTYSAAKSSFRLASSLTSNEERTRGFEDFSSKNGSLIEHLERQKEKTSILLQKSKDKHSEMISMSLFKN